MNKEILISSPEDMRKFGENLGEQHKILLLHGELWAGKTTLAKGFAKTLWINPEQVQSPTYTYLNIYDNKLLHIDMYRLKSFEEMIEKGIIDQMNDFDYILIERPKWIENIELWLYTEVNIEKTWDTERKIKLKIKD